MSLPLTLFQFRFCPARYIHIEQVPEPLARLAQALPDWRHHSAVNAWLMTELALPAVHECPAVLGGISLYEQSALESTFAAIGGLLHSQAIQQLVDASSLLRIHTAIGEEGHRYCLQKWRLIIGGWPAGWQQPLPAGELRAYLLHCGLQFWMRAGGAADEGYAKRLTLRLPPCPATPQWSISDEQLELALTLCLKVARERSPACFHLLK